MPGQCHPLRPAELGPRHDSVAVALNGEVAAFAQGRLDRPRQRSFRAAHRLGIDQLRGQIAHAEGKIKFHAPQHSPFAAPPPSAPCRHPCAPTLCAVPPPASPAPRGGPRPPPASPAPRGGPRPPPAPARSPAPGYLPVPPTARSAPPAGTSMWHRCPSRPTPQNIDAAAVFAGEHPCHIDVGTHAARGASV